VPPYTGPNVGTFVEALGKYDLLAYMNKYWINQVIFRDPFSFGESSLIRKSKGCSELRFLGSRIQQACNMLQHV
jgi:hypothetical protein